MSSSAPVKTSGVLQNLLFLVLWNLANVLPWLMAGFVYRYLPINALFWLMACLFAGIAQWFVLSRYIANLAQWAMATFLGGIIGYVGFATYIFAYLVTPLLTGLSVGIAQWLVLRHKLTGAFWWIVTTTIGAIAGLAVGFILPISGPASEPSKLEYTVFALGIGIEIGSSIITGCTMLWLLKRNANRKAVLNHD